MITAIRILAWLILAAIAFITLGPSQYRPETSLSHDAEHALAFLVLGMAFGLGYLRHYFVIAIGAIPVIGLIEILQLWSPGRHARVEDFVVNLLAFWAVLAAIGGAWLLAQRRSTNKPLA